MDQASLLPASYGKAVLNLPWTQTEKDNALAECRLSLRAWVSKKPMLCLHAVTDEEGHPLEDEVESGRRLSTFWNRVFESRTEDERHHAHETILEYVRKAWKMFSGKLTSRNSMK